MITTVTGTASGESITTTTIAIGGRKESCPSPLLVRHEAELAVKPETLPLASGPLAAHALFRFEWNLRMATVAGLIGAGGVGQALFESQQLMFYRSMMAYLIVTVVMVATADVLNERTRRRFGWSYVAR